VAGGVSTPQPENRTVAAKRYLRRCIDRAAKTGCWKETVDWRILTHCRTEACPAEEWGQGKRPPATHTGARQNSSGISKHRSLDSSFPSLPSVGFSGRQPGRRIPTEANKGNEELGQGQEGERGSIGRGIRVYMGLLQQLSFSTKAAPADRLIVVFTGSPLMIEARPS
jgi:hypothetical protein